MANLILQEFVPLITAFVIMLNSIGGIFGVVVVPYNPERVEVTLGSNVISNVDEVLECYNSAVKKTGFVLGSSSYDLSEFSFDTDNEDIKQLAEIYVQSLESSSTAVFDVPGEGIISSSDVKSAKMSVKDGKKTIIINVKDYSHEASDNKTDNPISNAYGYSTDMFSAFESNGVTISGGDMEISYTDCTISCVIDEKSGKIIYGDWDTSCLFEADNLTMNFKDTKITIGDFSFKTVSYIDV